MSVRIKNFNPLNSAANRDGVMVFATQTGDINPHSTCIGVMHVSLGSKMFYLQRLGL